MRFLCFVIVLLVAGPAFAQGSPFSPLKKSPSELLKLDSYARSPVKLEGFTLVDTKQVLVGNRLDFQQTYDVPYWDLVTKLEESQKKREPVSILDAELVPNTMASKLLVMGVSTKPNGELRMTLGDPKLPLNFVIDLSSDDQSRAVVTVQSAVRTQLYGGSQPARAPYKPVGANPVKFIWE